MSEGIDCAPYTPFLAPSYILCIPLIWLPFKWRLARPMASLCARYVRFAHLAVCPTPLCAPGSSSSLCGSRLDGTGASLCERGRCASGAFREATRHRCLPTEPIPSSLRPGLSCGTCTTKEDAAIAVTSPSHAIASLHGCAKHATLSVVRYEAHGQRGSVGGGGRPAAWLLPSRWIAIHGLAQPPNANAAAS